ncbi:MAG: hypothetical protein FWC50_11885 [Planctomycetaceae bacterium]|nr:hypothetical protein [Planctomycetaceae bacterium]
MEKETNVALIALIGTVISIIGTVIGIVISVIANSRVTRLNHSLEKKNYISKVRFNKEFVIYEEISEALSLAIGGCCWLFQEKYPMSENKEQRAKFFQDHYAGAVQDAAKFEALLESKQPFIPENIYNGFYDIRNLCYEQINMFHICGPLWHDTGNDEQKTELRRESISRSTEIAEKHKEVLKNIQKRLVPFQGGNDF